MRAIVMCAIIGCLLFAPFRAMRAVIVAYELCWLEGTQRDNVAGILADEYCQEQKAPDLLNQGRVDELRLR